MKVYIDLLILLNLDLDFVLLLSVSVILKRNVSLKRIFFGSLFGSLTIFILFFKISFMLLFLLKVVLGVFMVIITFGYHDIKYTWNNFYYLMVNGIILGGGLYLIKDYFYYNYAILIIGFSLIIFIYVRKMVNYKCHYTNYFKVNIYVNNNEYRLNGYLDTGNKLYDQYHHRPVILINSHIKYRDEDVIYVPCSILNSTSLVKCLKPERIVINKKVYKNYLIGLANQKFMIDGVNCLLHSCLKGELL